MIESSRRSSWAASLLASTTDVSTVNTATTAAAAAADASATRVRSDADLPSRRRTSGLVAQHVPDPADRVDHPGVAFALELASEVADEHVGDVRVDVEVVTPHQFEQPLPGQHHSGILRKDGEQVELALGQ